MNQQNEPNSSPKRRAYPKKKPKKKLVMRDIDEAVIPDPNCKDKKKQGQVQKQSEPPAVILETEEEFLVDLSDDLLFNQLDLTDKQQEVDQIQLPSVQTTNRQTETPILKIQSLENLIRPTMRNSVSFLLPTEEISKYSKSKKNIGSEIALYNYGPQKSSKDEKNDKPRAYLDSSDSSNETTDKAKGNQNKQSKQSIQNRSENTSKQSKNSKKSKRNRNRKQSNNTLNDSQPASSCDDEPKLNMMDPELCTSLVKKFALVTRSSGVSNCSKYSDPSNDTMKKSTTTSDPESLSSLLKPNKHEKNNVVINVQRRTQEDPSEGLINSFNEQVKPDNQHYYQSNEQAIYEQQSQFQQQYQQRPWSGDNLSNWFNFDFQEENFVQFINLEIRKQFERDLRHQQQASNMGYGRSSGMSGPVQMNFQQQQYQQQMHYQRGGQY